MDQHDIVSHMAVAVVFSVARQWMILVALFKRIFGR
jgi:hypothetical protein